MTNTTQEIIEQFARLPISEKREVASVILRDTLETETPDLSDDEFIFNAEDIFLELDRREEAQNGES
ncbi:MAG: hypothetical protein ACR2MG_06855 [Pyrinomonadaceae bacterium]